MSRFGLTSDAWCQSLGVKESDFDRGGAKGADIISDAMDSASAFILSYLPKRDERLLRRVDYEWVERSAYSGMTTVVLAAPVNGTNSLVIWTYAQGTTISNFPTRGDGNELTAYTLGSKLQTVTFTTALSEGDMVIASYNCSLADKCETLNMVLRAVLCFELASEVLPDAFPRYQARYNAVVAYLEKLQAGQAILKETETIETMDEVNPQSGNTLAAQVREPA